MTDTSQFEAFMAAYQNLVYSTAMRLLSNGADAEDIAQEVFVRAFDHYDDLRNSATVGGWLKTVTRNLCLNHLSRYRARWRFFSEMAPHDEESSFEQDLPAPELPVGAGASADDRQILEEALQSLPAAQRVPLVLYHFEEMSYEDIAGRLKISLSKVKTDIHRARAALRRKLSRRAEELGAGVPPTTASRSGPGATPHEPPGGDATDGNTTRNQRPPPDLQAGSIQTRFMAPAVPSQLGTLNPLCP